MYSAGQYIWHHRLYLEPVHTQVIGLTINVKEEIALEKPKRIVLVLFSSSSYRMSSSSATKKLFYF